MCVSSFSVAGCFLREPTLAPLSHSCEKAFVSSGCVKSQKKNRKRGSSSRIAVLTGGTGTSKKQKNLWTIFPKKRLPKRCGSAWFDCSRTHSISRKGTHLCVRPLSFPSVGEQELSNGKKFGDGVFVKGETEHQYVVPCNRKRCRTCSAHSMLLVILDRCYIQVSC